MVLHICHPCSELATILLLISLKPSLVVDRVHTLVHLHVIVTSGPRRRVNFVHSVGLLDALFAALTEQVGHGLLGVLQVLVDLAVVS